MIAAATVITSALCFSKFRGQPDEIDMLGKTVISLKTIIPENRPVAIQMVGAKTEYGVFTRYFLAPQRVSFPHVMTDTVLIINGRKWDDSVMAHTINNKKILWRSTDTVHSYTLICNR